MGWPRLTVYETIKEDCMSVCLCHWRARVAPNYFFKPIATVPRGFEHIHAPLDPVHTTSFSNENGTVLLRFQNTSRPHLSFPYRFRPSTIQRVSVLKTFLNLIFFHSLPPFFLYYFPCDKLKLSHYAEVRLQWSCPEPSRFWRASTESFLLSSFRPKLPS